MVIDVAEDMTRLPAASLVDSRPPLLWIPDSSPWAWASQQNRYGYTALEVCSIRKFSMTLLVRLALAAIVLVLAVPSSGAPLTIYVQVYSGRIYAGEGGTKVEGPGADLLERVLALAGVPGRLQLAPFARAHVNTEHIPDVCFAGMVRTPEREARFKWAGPIARIRSMLYARADSKVELLSLAEASALSIGAIRGSMQAQLLKDRGLKVVEAADDVASLRMLAAKRIDLIIMNDLSAKALFQDYGQSAPQPVYEVMAFPSYIACNIGVSDESMRKLNSSIRAMAEAGEFAYLGLLAPSRQTEDGVRSLSQVFGDSNGR